MKGCSFCRGKDGDHGNGCPALTKDCTCRQPRKEDSVGIKGLHDPNCPQHGSAPSDQDLRDKMVKELANSLGLIYYEEDEPSPFAGSWVGDDGKTGYHLDEIVKPLTEVAKAYSQEQCRKEWEDFLSVGWTTDEVEQYGRASAAILLSGILRYAENRKMKLEENVRD